MCLEHDFGHFNFLKLQDVFWDLDPTPYFSTNPDKTQILQFVMKPSLSSGFRSAREKAVSRGSSSMVITVVDANVKCESALNTH